MQEDVATTLINVMQKENMAKEFLAELIMSDIEKIGIYEILFFSIHVSFERQLKLLLLLKLFE